MFAIRRYGSDRFTRLVSCLAIVAPALLVPIPAIRAADMPGISATNPVLEDVEQRCAKASDPRTTTRAVRFVRFISSGGKTVGPWKRDVAHRSEDVIRGGSDMFEQLEIADVRVAADATEVTVRRVTAVGRRGGVSRSWCYLAGKLARASASVVRAPMVWSHTKWFDETGALANEATHVVPVGARYRPPVATSVLAIYPTFERNPYYAPYRAALSKALAPLTVPIVRDI